MHYKEYIPQHPSLKELVKCFWVFENIYGENHFERMIPDGHIDFVFHYGQKPKLLIEGKEIVKPTNFLGGHLSSPALLKFSGELKMFGIKFYPWASASLYKMDAFELNNQRVPAEAILGKWTKDVYNLLMNELNEGNYQPAISKLEISLVKNLQRLDRINPILKKGFERIMTSKGFISIDEFSREAGCTPRYVQKIFRTKKGMPFNYYARLARLHDALNKIKLTPSVTSTSLAYDSGYFDQSHFIKDFVRFTGVTPTKFFSEEHLYITQNAASGLLVS